MLLSLLFLLLYSNTLFMFPSYIIREQILKENAAFLKEKEDYQIRRDTLQLRLVCEDNIQFLYVHKRKTLAETTVRFVFIHHQH